MQAVELDTIPTGLALVRALTEHEATALDEAGKLARIVAWERVTAWVAAGMNTAIVEYVGLTPRVQQVQLDGRTLALPDVTRTELACALHWSENSAGLRIELARTLARELPGTTSALQEGTLSLLHARAIAEGAQRLLTPIDHARNLAHNADPAGSPDAQLLELREQLLTAFEERVVPYASSHNLARSREQITRTINRLDPDGVTNRRAQALGTQSGVSVRHGDDGMSTLNACMPSELAVACLRTIDALATQRRNTTAGQDGSVRAETMGQLRVQAFADLLLGDHASGCTNATCITRGEALSGCRSTAGDDSRSTAAMGGADAAAPRVAGSGHATLPTAIPRIAVDVVIDLPTLLGLREGVATLNGAGAIPAHVVRDLIAGDEHATLRRLVVDPDQGHLLEAGTRRYAITGRLRDYLVARDQRCRFPDCGRRAENTDIDHATPWDDGGASTPDNLGALCRIHHLRKTHTDWAISDSDLTGACTWTTPTGAVIRHDAITRLDAHDEAVAALQQQLREVWEQLETAREYAASTAPAMARRAALHDAIDAQHVRGHLDTLNSSRRHGYLCTILSHELQRHQQRNAQARGDAAGTSDGTAVPAETSSSDDTPPF